MSAFYFRNEDIPFYPYTLIDCCLTPILAIFQLYCGVIFLRRIIY